MLYGIPERLTTDCSPQFVGEFFNAACIALGTRLMMTTAYYCQTNGQTERFNKTIISWLCPCISKHQDNWDTFFQPLTYVYNAQMEATTETISFSLVLTREPTAASGQPHLSNISSQQKKSLTSKKLRNIQLDRIGLIRARATEAASREQQRFKMIFDKKTKPIPVFEENDLVYQDTNSSITSKKANAPSQKLQAKNGPV